MEDVKGLWKGCLAGIAEHVSPQNYSTWFKPVRVSSGGDDFLELEVPNRFCLEWLKDHYVVLIKEVLRKLAKKDLELYWRIADEKPDEPREKTVLATDAGAASSAKTQKATVLPVLSPKYTFENFVIGKANEFAHAACSSVAKQLASKYNPLFIYGGVGLGKTHLLQAIGHSVLENNPSFKVCYYTSERFMNDFINFVSRNKMSEFRGRFRNVDVLLIDDIQFWAGKERTQEEFFHTFNTLYEAHKQIVVTSDKFPKDIGVEERLRSRFEWGLIADIQPPDVETKIAILRKRAKGEGIRLSDEIAGWLATVSGANIRELEGNLNRIIAVSSLTNQEITLAMCKEALKGLLKEAGEKNITIDEILKAVSVFFNLKTADIKSKRRHKNITLPRQIAMYIARVHGGFSFPEIGAALGGKDHSTVIHAVKKIEKNLKDDAEVKQAIKTIKQNLLLAS